MRLYQLIAGRSRWAGLAIALTLIVSLVAANAAQAIVVNDQGTTYGVALVPGTSGSLAPAGMSPVSASGPCSDPALTSDLSYAAGSQPLCWRGGNVLDGNETFALTWDPNRSYWSGTRGYVEQFLRDVADSSGALGSPYAVTTQYTDGNGRAGNSSKYGGGCIDYGVGGGSDCQIGTGTNVGHDYPGASAMGSCYVSGSSPCLTDGDIRGEISAIAGATLLSTHTQTGYAPVIVVLTAPGVVVCLDSTGTLCSANRNSSAQFCSYHAQLNGIVYVVQPWTIYTGCDEPNLPALSHNPTPQQLATDAGSRLVNPLSQGEIAAITDPGFNGWVASDGSEINDNGGCQPGGPSADTVGLGSNSYVVQREFNNAGAIESEPNTYFGCAPNVILSPSFVVPSAVDQGDVVELDGSSTASTLIVPNAGYKWNFGDGTTAAGPSVVHSYSAGGNYIVTLTVTDRGGNVANLSQSVQVLGANGQPVNSSNPQSGTNSGTTSSSGGGSGSGGLRVRIQLLPQGLRTVLRSGIVIRVSSTAPANGIATVSISRAAAKRAHIKTGRGGSVVIGRGTLSSIKDGTVSLHLALSRAINAKLKGFKHLTFTIRLTLVGTGGLRTAVDAAGRY